MLDPARYAKVIAHGWLFSLVWRGYSCGHHARAGPGVLRERAVGAELLRPAERGRQLLQPWATPWSLGCPLGAGTGRVPCAEPALCRPPPSTPAAGGALGAPHAVPHRGDGRAAHAAGSGAAAAALPLGTGRCCTAALQHSALMPRLLVAVLLGWCTCAACVAPAAVCSPRLVDTSK